MWHQLYTDWYQVKGKQVSAKFRQYQAVFQLFARQLPSFSFDMQSVFARRPRFPIFIQNQKDKQMHEMYRFEHYFTICEIQREKYN